MKIQELEKLFVEHHEVAESRQALKGFLKDLFPQEKLEVNLLLHTYDVGIVEELQNGAIDAFLISRMEKRVIDEHGIEAAKAKWAVDMWCRAYGVKVLGKQIEEDETANKQSQEKPSEKKNAAQINVGLNMCMVGDIVKFGSYWQENPVRFDKTPIEWQVLDKKGNKALLISKYALDCKPYNTYYTRASWQTCTLCEWLNEEFLNDAFTSDEQRMIKETAVTSGNETKNKVFLLSINEVNKYFESDEARKCSPTVYAKSLGAWTSHMAGGKAACWWWLRSSGNGHGNAADVGIFGGVVTFGHNVNRVDFAVRPAMWVSLK